MPKCYILCNIDNPGSDYIRSNYAGSNMSFYLGGIVRCFSDVVFVNVGAPTKKWDKDNKHFLYDFDNYSIVEFSGFYPSFFPTRIKARRMIKDAVNYILKHKEQCDFLLVYHSLSFCQYYNRLVSSFGMNSAILHVAEFYSDVGNIKYDKTKEINYIKCFKKYIFMSNGLAKQVDKEENSKNHILIYGSYNVVPLVSRKDDDKIHVVYAGTTSKIKGGLYNALKASMYLPSNFVVHIYCQSSDEVLKELKKYNVVYGGYIKEDELNKLLIGFDVGLSTQNPFLSFNESSFPSKIVNYLACGLNVVSSKTKSVIESPFDRSVFYYDEDETGENIAKAIIIAANHIDKVKNQKQIVNLDFESKAKIKELFERENFSD